MPLDVQVKLLRVVETRSLERLGSNKTIPLDIRIVGASKVDLAVASNEGEFRQDLYFRLNVAAIDLPPLRDRGEDIMLLFYRLARQARARFRKEIPEVTPEIVAQLHGYDWPGNVRDCAILRIGLCWVWGLGCPIARTLWSINLTALCPRKWLLTKRR